MTALHFLRHVRQHPIDENVVRISNAIAITFGHVVFKSDLQKSERFEPGGCWACTRFGGHECRGNVQLWTIDKLTA